MAMRRQTRLASESAIFLVVLAAIAILVNMLGVFGVNLRADATEAGVFSLAPGSKRVAGNLDDQLEIRAYFSEDLPAPHNALPRYVRDLLAEYADAGKGKVTVRFISPKTDEDKQAAERDGIDRMQDQMLDAESDSFVAKEGYRGISFHYLGDTKSIRHVDGTEGLEYEITQTLKQLVGEKVKIGVLGGTDGPSLAKGLATLKQYLPTYELTEVEADKEIPKEIKALLIVHPEKTLSENTLRYVNQYVMRGGSLGVYGGGIKVDMEQGSKPTGIPVDTGLNKLLEKWGLTIDNRIVADAQCGRARMQTNIPGYVIPVPYPPVPIITFDEQQSKHPAAFKVNQLGLPYSVRLAQNDNLKADKAVKTTVLAKSTPKSWLMEGNPIDLEAKERPQVPGFSGPYVIGVAIEGKLPSAFGEATVSTTPESEQAAPSPINAPERAEKSARVLVFGSGFFMRDEFLPPPQPGENAFSGGMAFALNSIDWLANDNDLVAIRAKTVEEPTLEVPQTVREAEATIRDAQEGQDEAMAKAMIEKDDSALKELKSKTDAALEQRKAAMAEWNRKKNLYKWSNGLAVPGAFALFGIVRWRVRRARKARLTL